MDWSMYLRVDISALDLLVTVVCPCFWWRSAAYFLRLLQRGGHRLQVYPAGRRAHPRQRQRGADQLLPHLRRAADLCGHPVRCAQGGGGRSGLASWRPGICGRFWTSGHGPGVAKYWAGLFCLLGHMFPCMFHFKGGKGILSGGTIAIMIDWRIALVVWGGFLILAMLTRYVSLGSMLGGGQSFPFVTWFVYQDVVLTGSGLSSSAA